MANYDERLLKDFENEEILDTEIIKKTELQRLLEIRSQDILTSSMRAQEQGWREKNLFKRNQCYRTATYLKRIAENLQILKKMHKLED